MRRERICIIGGGGQVAEALGALFVSRGFTPVYFRPEWKPVVGVPRRPERSRSRLGTVEVTRTVDRPLGKNFELPYRWATRSDLARADVFVFAMPSFLAEIIGAELASYLSGKVVLNISDRFLGTYAVAMSARQRLPSLPPLRLGMAFNSPPLLAYQPVRGCATHLYYEKPYVMMGCFPRSQFSEAVNWTEALFGIPARAVRLVPTLLELAFENVNSIHHAVQDLENLKVGLYAVPGRLYTDKTYTRAMVARMCGVADERSRIASHFVACAPRTLKMVDETTYHETSTLSAFAGGSAEYRCSHPILRDVPSPTLATAHGYEDVGWSMVPMESFARLARLATPMLTSLIDEWSAFMRVDYRAVGRTAQSLGLTRGTDHPNPRAWSWQYDIY